MNQTSKQHPVQMNELADEQHNSMSNRVKSGMASTGRPRRRRESLLDAASALASLGGGSPQPSDQGSSPRPSDTDEKSPDSPFSKRGVPATSADETRALPSLPKPSSLRGDIPMTFPEKLMEVLDNEQISDIVTWLPHGKGFVIVQKRRFASEVLPIYFKQSKFTSFTRKLNRWGFVRVTDGPETGAYYHDLFERGNHMLCMQMHCQSTSTSKAASSGTSSKSPPSRSPGTPSPSSSPPLQDLGDGNSNFSRTGKSQQGYVDQHMVAFDLVLSRQRELLRQSQTTERREDSSSCMVGDRSSRFDSVFDRQQQLLRANNINNSYRPQNVSQSYRQLQDIMMQDQPQFNEASMVQHQQLLRSSYLDVSDTRHHQDMFQQTRFNDLDRVRQQQQSFHRGLLQEQSDITDLDLVAETERLLGQRQLPTRRHHRLIMESALNALKSSETPSSQGQTTSPPKLQTPLHSAMHQELRRLEEHNRCVEDALKKECGQQMFSQNDVARLHNQIGERHVFSSGVFGSPSQLNSSSSSPGQSRSVRRASAA